MTTQVGNKTPKLTKTNHLFGKNIPYLSGGEEKKLYIYHNFDKKGKNTLIWHTIYYSANRRKT